MALNRRGAARARVSNSPALGLRENAAQFSLLVALNALVGGMVGLERSVLPLVGERDFGLTSTSAILAFVVAFGLAKAITNLAAGALANHVGRKRLLCSAGSSLFRCRCSSGSRHRGASSSRRTSCSASTRASPGP